MERNLLAFNKANITRDKKLAGQWNHLQQRRGWATHQEKVMAANAGMAALLPRDAYRELDEMTMRVIRNDEGETYMKDLMPLARSIHVGKTLSQYRVSNDKQAGVTRSMGGRVPENLDKVSYDFEGDPVGIFANGTVREWRENESFMSESFDEMADDLEARVAELKQDVAQYMLNGDTKFQVNGFSGQGIRNHRHTKQINLGAAGSNIDLSAIGTTNDAIINFFIDDFGTVLDDNHVRMETNLYVSPEIMRRFEVPYANSQGFQGGTLYEYILKLTRIKKIERTFELTGNNMFAFVADSKFIRPITGMAMSTFQVPRNNPFANHQILGWCAHGLRITNDANDRGGVFNFAATS